MAFDHASMVSLGYIERSKKMNEKNNIGINEELDELTVIDASSESMNTVDFSLDDDDNGDDDILYDGYIDEKYREQYTHGVRSVVFGSLSIVLPLLAWIIHLSGISLLPLTVAMAGIIFAVIGWIAALKCKNVPMGSLSEGLARTGKIVSIIGIALSVFILVNMIISIILTVLVLVVMVAIYVGAALMSVVIALLTSMGMI